jgi:predicted 2-oxoglutarate/Fe(II)-dependent dioxygenase YbiX
MARKKIIFWTKNMVRDGKKENHLLDQKHGKGWQERKSSFGPKTW